MSGLVDIWTVEFAKLREKKDGTTVVSASSTGLNDHSTHQSNQVTPKEGEKPIDEGRTITSSLFGRILGFYSSNPGVDVYTDATINMMTECFSP